MPRISRPTSYSSDGPGVKESATEAADSGFIPSWVKAIALKLVFVFITSLLDAQFLKGQSCVKNKLASLFVVPLGNAVSGILPSWCGRHMAGNS